MNANAHLIIYSPTLRPGGTERVVLNLCHHLQILRTNISVCTMESGLYADELQSFGINVCRLSSNFPGRYTTAGKAINYLNMLRCLNRIISAKQPVIVHSQHFGPLIQLFLLRKLFRVKFGWIHTEHSHDEAKKDYDKFFCRLFKPLRAPDIISGVTDTITHYLQDISGMPPGRSETVLNGIETSRLSSNPKIKKKIELGFNSDDLIVGAVGQLRTEKNQQMIIKAFAKLAPLIPNLHLVICGEGICRPELEELVSSLGLTDRVHMLGFRQDVYEIMSTFDVFCLPSVYEGLPLSILEAWAARLPVVGTDVVGINELVSDNNNGLLVRLNDEGQMATAISTLLQDKELANKLADNGHSLAVNKFDIKIMVNKYTDLYNRIFDSMNKHTAV